MSAVESTRYACPLDGCTWQLDRDDAQFAPTGVHVRLPSGTDPREAVAALMAGASAATAQAVEDELHRHLESHPLVDFVRTILTLHARLAARGRP